MRNVFSIKNLGESKFCLRIRINRYLKREKIFIDQERYCNQILKRFVFDGLNFTSTPMEVGLKLPSLKEIGYSKLNPYSESVDVLIYLIHCTRPDISLAVGIFSQFMAKHC